MTQDLARATVEEYRSRTPASEKHYERFCDHLPGGETRAVSYYEPYPVVLTEGHGAVIYDLDGNEYLDVLNNYTALVHGYGFAPALDAARAVLADGTVFPAPHLAQLEFAQMLTGRYGNVERVRFTNSGTEAALLALRVVRAATGRSNVVIFTGGYHGSIPEFLDGGGQTIRVPYNDTDRALGAIDSSVAAVFAEPFLGSGGVIPAAAGFLAAVEERAHGVGSLFVLDEVQSLRNAYGGMQLELGLDPDLVLMGKIIGGGFPVGALGGKAELLNLTSARHRGVLSHAGTFNGNVVTMSAGAASLRALDDETIAKLNERAGSLAGEITGAARRAGIAVSVTRSGSIMHVHLLAKPPDSSEAGAAVPSLWSAQLHLALLLEGVYPAPRGMLNLSTALDENQLAKVAAAYEKAFARIGPLISASETTKTAGS